MAKARGLRELLGHGEIKNLNGAVNSNGAT